MRLLRAAVVVALALPAAAAIPFNAAYAATPGAQYSVFTMTGEDNSYLWGSSTLLLDANADSNVTISASGNATGVGFHANSSTGEYWTAIVDAPLGSSLVAGHTYDATRGGDDSHAALDVYGDGRGCTEDTGTITIEELTLDSGGNLAAFAATFSESCNGGAPVTGELRWQSSIGYSVINGAPSNVQFGTVLVGEDSAAQTVTLTSRGASPATIGSVSLGGNSPQAFSIRGDTCTGTVLAQGGTCTVSVVAHPTASSAQQAMLIATNESAPGKTTVALTVTGSPNAIGTYYPLNTPTRLMDTRNGTGAPKAAIGPGGTVHLQVAGRGGVPSSGVSAVVLNLTVTGPTAGGYLTVFPTGTARPTASSLNFPAKWTGSNMVTVQLGTGGEVDIYNLAGSTQVIVDIYGFYAGSNTVLPTVGMGGDYQPTDPVRLLDTRTDTGAVPRGFYVSVPADFGVDVNPHVRAFAVNVTEVNAPAGGYLTAWDGVNDLPVASTVNFDAKTITPNMAVVPTSTCNVADCRGMPEIGVYNGSGSSVQIIVDLFGYYDDGTLGDGLVFHPMSPTRIVDSRIGLGVPTALGPNSTTTVTAPASVAGDDTYGLAMNVTAVSPTIGTYLIAWPTGLAQPTVSNLNPAKGATVSNSVWSLLGNGNTFNLYNLNGSTNLVVDVSGTFDPSPRISDTPPARSNLTAGRLALRSTQRSPRTATPHAPHLAPAS